MDVDRSGVGEFELEGGTTVMEEWTTVIVVVSEGESGFGFEEVGGVGVGEGVVGVEVGEGEAVMDVVDVDAEVGEGEEGEGWVPDEVKVGGGEPEKAG